MELKRYQTAALEKLQMYLEAVRAAQAKRAQLAATGIDIPYEWDKHAWQQAGGIHEYKPRTSKAGEQVPNVCFKIPTGGGKTFLATKAVGAINNIYRQKNTGLVLWVVPTTQIYRQTLDALRDRAHPYRQSLDLGSGGKTLILEKDTPFAPIDVEDHLAVLLLMLPAANRRNKETLRIFQDNGGFESFFPAEDEYVIQQDWLARVPNLETYASDEDVLGPIIKTSLGNTLRILNPVIVLDEGHKAYSELAQTTLLDFNPAFILELSATPTPNSNILVNIMGREVHREGMIKLNLNVYNKVSANWRDAMRASLKHREKLEQIAQEYEAEEGFYIRPICLIQVERTGQNQRHPGFIHAEDVREFLIEACSVLPEEIAVKSSERDEIEQIDLLSRDCPIRYIITKTALQEGWDCPYAYILTVLTNPTATTSITQLVGRVLRQPYARKTKRIELDESYVYCFRDKAGAVLQDVQKGLQAEGLDDVAHHVVVHDDSAPTALPAVELNVRPEFAQFTGKVYLPCFVVPDEHQGFREVSYEVDILSRIDWNSVTLDVFNTLELNPTTTQDSHTIINLDEAFTALRTSTADDMPIDPVFMTRQIIDMVPNPWVAYEFVEGVLGRLRRRFSDERIRRDMGFVIEMLKKHLKEQRRQLAKDVFHTMIKENQLRFFLVSGCVGGALPGRVVVKPGRPLVTTAGKVVQKSLFESQFEEDFNELERAVALYLEQQHWVLTWYRNAVRLGYSIQGWQEHRIYSDFIVLGHNAPEGSDLPVPSHIWVLETKGLHLKNEDTGYKQEVFKLCNELSTPKPWDAIAEEFSKHKVRFQVIFEDEWQSVINAMFNSDREC